MRSCIVFTEAPQDCSKVVCGVPGVAGPAEIDVYQTSAAQSALGFFGCLGARGGDASELLPAYQVPLESMHELLFNCIGADCAIGTRKSLLGVQPSLRHACLHDQLPYVLVGMKDNAEIHAADYPGDYPAPADFAVASKTGRQLIPPAA
jgi:hypothetical protein